MTDLSQHSTLLITNGTVMTMDESFTIIENGAVLISGDSIVKTGPSTELETNFKGRIIDADGGIVMPGLVNAHTHLPMSLFRGLADDLPLMTWLNDHIFPAEAAHINPDTVYLGSLLSCAEMLLSGTTCCCDGYFHEDKVAEAVLKSGLRGVLAQGVIDFPAPGVPDPARNVEVAAAYAREWKTRDSRISPSIFCHSPYTCSEQTLKGAKQAARDAGVLFQIHVAETRQEWDQIKADKGVSPISYLDRLGILDENTLLIHAVFVDEKDRERIFKRNAAVVHAPESNMKLASGISPVPGFIRQGIRTGLGTDGSASNNNLDMFGEMDTTAKLHKAIRNNPTVMDAKTVLRMATLGSANAIGLGHVTGSLEPGKKADLIIVDTEKPHLQPMYHPVSQLVYAATGADVRDVIVNGSVVVENRIIKTLDLPGMLKEIRTFAITMIKPKTKND